MRIVSLAPSATEILGLLGAGGELVGRSHGCDGAPWIASVPVLTRPIHPGQRAASDPRLEQVLLNSARLIELRPDLIIVPEGLRGFGLDADPAGSPRVLTLGPETVEDALDDVLRVGEAIGRAREASEAVVRLRGWLHAAQDHVNPYTPGRSVGFVVWADPIHVAGGLTVQLIERAGGRHPLNATTPRPGVGTASGPQQGERIAGPPRRVSDEAFVAAGPEVLIIAPRGPDISAARAALAVLKERPWFGSLPAALSGRVALVDGRVFDIPGPSLAGALEFLVGYINQLPRLIPRDFPWEPAALGDRDA